MRNKDTDNSLILSQTGNQFDNQTKRIKKDFGKYLITIDLSLDNKFIKIIEIEENKKYLDVEKKKLIPTYLDVSEFYED
jgi:hypothetical protein